MGINKEKLDRRGFLATVGGGALLLSLRGQAFSASPLARMQDDLVVYVGTYTTGTASQGIYSYKFKKATGELASNNIKNSVVDPSYLVVDKKGRYLYAVNETVEYEGKKSGSISSFSIDRKTGELKFLNKQASLGGAPCYMTLSANGRFLLVANYVGGNVAVFPVKADGTLGETVDLQQHTGTGPVTDRQESAHAHSIDLDRKNRFAVSCDLGADKLFIYTFDKNSGKLTANPAQPFLSVKPGTGPRHFAFHPNGKAAFVINELASTVTSLTYNEKLGTLAEVQTISTLPVDWSGANTCAEIQVSSNGRFVYGSNRGHDSVVCYSFDAATGKLELVGHWSTSGKTPRNFAIDPSGRYLLAANQNSSSITTFRINDRSGKLQQLGEPLSVPAPVCLKFFPA